MSPEERRVASAKGQEAQRTVYAPDEVRQYRDFVEDALAGGRSDTRTIVARMRKKYPGVSRKYASNFVRRVLDEWSSERGDPRGKEDARSRAIARLRGYIRVAMGVPKMEMRPHPENPSEMVLMQVGWLVERDDAALAKYEGLLMKLEGTEAPLEINVEVRHQQALAGVLYNLSQEQVAEMIARRRALEAQAAEGRRVIAQLPGGAQVLTGDTRVSPRGPRH